MWAFALPLWAYVLVGFCPMGFCPDTAGRIPLLFSGGFQVMKSDWQISAPLWGWVRIISLHTKSDFLLCVNEQALTNKFRKSNGAIATSSKCKEIFGKNCTTIYSACRIGLVSINGTQESVYVQCLSKMLINQTRVNSKAYTIHCCIIVQFSTSDGNYLIVGLIAF